MEHLNADSRLGQNGGEIEEIDLKELLSNLMKYKWSILLTTLLVTLLVLVYLYFKPSVYRSSALIEVKSNAQQNIDKSDFLASAFQNLGNEKIDKEIEILKTYYINNGALNKINFKVQYYVDSGFKKVEIYKDTPIKVEDITVIDKTVAGKLIAIVPDGNAFRLKVKRSFFKKIFDIVIPDDKKIIIDEQTLHKYNTPVETEYFELTVNKIEPKNNSTIYFKLNGNNRQIFSGISKSLSVSQISKKAPLIKVEFEDTKLERADQYVNALVDTFIEQSISDKSKKTNRLIDFINGQLKITKKKLDEYESRLERYKIEHSAQEGSVQAVNYIGEMNNMENQIADFKLKKNLTEEILRAAKEDSSLDSVSTSLIKLDDRATMNLINSLQTLQIKEEELRAKYSYIHPSLKSIRKQIFHIKKKIVANIKSMNSRVSQKIISLKKLRKSYQGKLDSLPTKERMLVGLKRDYDVTSNIYDQLLKKRSQNKMIKVAILSDYRVIDYAKNTTGTPVKPKRLLVFLLGLILGLILGVVQALIRSYFDDKIKSRSDLEDLTALPIYGIIPEVKKHDIKLEIFQDTKSPFAESLRSLRTNLQFSQQKNKCHVVLVTSTIAGEGKSTTTANLAGIFQMAGYKSIVINLDMRKPTLHKYFNINNSIGMSTYLSAKSGIAEIIQTSQHENLDVISSGPIPPNPSELIMSDRLGDLIDGLRERYDYVFIDSAPLGLVTDTMNIMKYADINLIVFREDYAKKVFIKDLNSLVKRHNLQHIGLVLNGSDMRSGAYGYGYGY